MPAASETRVVVRAARPTRTLPRRPPAMRSSPRLSERRRSERQKQQVTEKERKGRKERSNGSSGGRSRRKEAAPPTPANGGSASARDARAESRRAHRASVAEGTRSGAEIPPRARRRPRKPSSKAGAAAANLPRKTPGSTRTRLVPVLQPPAFPPETDLGGEPSLGYLRQKSRDRLKFAFDSICERYGRDFGEDCDEIDLATGRLVVDRGFVRSAPANVVGTLARFIGVDGKPVASSGVIETGSTSNRPVEADGFADSDGEVGNGEQEEGTSDDHDSSYEVYDEDDFESLMTLADAKRRLIEARKDRLQGSDIVLPCIRNLHEFAPEAVAEHVPSNQGQQQTKESQPANPAPFDAKALHGREDGVSETSPPTEGASTSRLPQEHGRTELQCTPSNFGEGSPNGVTAEVLDSSGLPAKPLSVNDLSSEQLQGLRRLSSQSEAPEADSAEQLALDNDILPEIVDGQALAVPESPPAPSAGNFTGVRGESFPTRSGEDPHQALPTKPKGSIGCQIRTADAEVQPSEPTTDPATAFASKAPAKPRQRVYARDEDPRGLLAAAPRKRKRSKRVKDTRESARRSLSSDRKVAAQDVYAVRSEMPRWVSLSADGQDECFRLPDPGHPSYLDRGAMCCHDTRSEVPPWTGCLGLPATSRVLSISGGTPSWARSGQVADMWEPWPSRVHAVGFADGWLPCDWSCPLPVPEPEVHVNPCGLWIHMPLASDAVPLETCSRERTLPVEDENELYTSEDEGEEGDLQRRWRRFEIAYGGQIG